MWSDHAELVLRWLERNSHPVDVANGIDLPEGYFDGVEIVGLGEGTHGTREFTIVRQAVFETLVADYGFRTLAIEAPFFEVLKLDKYVRTGEGNPEKGVCGNGYWLHSTEAMLDLVKWIREFNKDHLEDPVRIVGIDPVFPNSAVLCGDRYLKRVDPTFAESISSRSKPDRAKVMLETFSTNKDRYVTVSSFEEWQSAQHCVEHALQGFELQRVRDQPTNLLVDVFRIRDQILAENLDWVMKTKKTGGVAVWAHNMHTGTHFDVDYMIARSPSLGYWIRKKYGARYHTIATTSAMGDLRALPRSMKPYEIVNFTAVKPPKGSVEDLFSRVKMEGYIADLRRLDRDSPETQWFYADQYMRSIGATYHRSRFFSWEEIAPALHFDSIIFLRSTTASRALNCAKYSGTYYDD